jgi:hypothetical protein
MDNPQGQIDYILVKKFEWKLDVKLANIFIALHGRVNWMCN